MEVILIQGKENTGKTTLCKMVECFLIQNDFEVVQRRHRPECGHEQDFTASYKKDGCRIIINSESEKGGVNRFQCVYGKCPYDIIITAIRPEDSNSSLNKWIRRVYENDFEGEEYIIDLDAERINNKDLDFCEFIEKVLKEKANEIWEKLNCQIKINMPIK